jgi:hypothetical protein
VPLVLGLRALAGEAKVTSAELRAAGRTDFSAARAAAIKENGGKCVYCNSQADTQGDHIKSLKQHADEVNAGQVSNPSSRIRPRRKPSRIREPTLAMILRMHDIMHGIPHLHQD